MALDHPLKGGALDSADANDAAMMRCANCGITESDDIKLKTCTACKSAKYCGIKCQKEHRPKHKKACKHRAAELRDELLFKQPESTHLGDCPICCLPLHYEQDKYRLMSCCSKFTCNGCEQAHSLLQIKGKKHPKCPFCRSSNLVSQDDIVRNLMTRVETNDPVAMREMGLRLQTDGDLKGAFGYFTRAAALGDVESHMCLSNYTLEGVGPEKNTKKMVHHLEEAAIGGHIKARHQLGEIEWENGMRERAVRHYIIASNLGFEPSLARLKDIYAKTKGLIKKDELAAALRAYQSAVEARKSSKRGEADLMMKQYIEWTKNERDNSLEYQEWVKNGRPKEYILNPSRIARK